jgi:hypothetical protein
MHALENRQRKRVNLALWMTSGAECSEALPAPKLQQRLGDDASRGVTRAQEQDVVDTLAHILLNQGCHADHCRS